MKLVLAEEMRQLDKYAEDELGIPGLLLMENASRAVADEATALLQDCFGKNIIILCGKGNNGGDGFGAARWLMNRGASVKVILAGSQADLSGSAADELQYYLAGDGKVLELLTDVDLEQVEVLCSQADLLIDALLGTGFTGSLRNLYRDLCVLINRNPVKVLAVDIPTGVNADTGEADEDAVRADATVTMALPKQGLYLYPGADCVGKLTVADIGMPEKMLREAKSKRYILSAEMVAEMLPLRPKNLHKGTAGRAILAAGSHGYTGAPALCARGCVYSGAGLVTLYTPSCVREILSVKLDEAMVRPLPEIRPGQLAPKAVPDFLTAAAQADAAALGPGWGTNREAAEVVRRILQAIAVPCVIDADALTALQGHTQLLEAMKAPKILTPHPGEMGRLLNLPAGQVDQERVEIAREYAAKWQAVLVLKGVPTVIAHPDGHVFLNPTGNPSMATGGSGDTLTGIITGLLAQKMSLLEAALAGVYLHGLAGDLAARERTGMAAGDLALAFPRARYLVENGLAGQIV
jgi:hydroxyethylthiazole kinase-like uncharacterized protein yjeF